jgi:hypothetical protein
VLSKKEEQYCVCGQRLPVSLLAIMRNFIHTCDKCGIQWKSDETKFHRVTLSTLEKEEGV